MNTRFSYSSDDGSDDNDSMIIVSTSEINNNGNVHVNNNISYSTSNIRKHDNHDDYDDDDDDDVDDDDDDDSNEAKVKRLIKDLSAFKNGKYVDIRNNEGTCCD